MIEIFYWILLLIWLVLGFFPDDRPHWRYGRSILLFILFVLLGLKIFSNPLR